MNITKAERERLAEMVKDIFPSYLPGRFDDDIESIRSLILNPPSVTKDELRAFYKTGTWDSYFDWAGLTELLRSRGVEVVE